LTISTHDAILHGLFKNHSGVRGMEAALQIASILVSVLLIILILLQVKGGGLSNLLGGDAGGGITRTRRGLEKTLFQITIVMAALFIGISILAVIAFG
jgi:preprotein translocase subunit SecG